MSDKISKEDQHRVILNFTQEETEQLESQLIDEQEWVIDWSQLSKEIQAAEQDEIEREKRLLESAGIETSQPDSTQDSEALSPQEVQQFIADAWTDDEVPFMDMAVINSVPNIEQGDSNGEFLRPEVLDCIAKGLTKGTREKYSK